MTQRTGTVVVVSVAGALIVAGGIYLLVGRNHPQPTQHTTTPEASIAAQTTGTAHDIATFLDVKAKSMPASRIELIGNSLVSAPPSVLSQRLNDETKRDVRVDDDASMTSASALSTLSGILVNPPRYLVLDLGRFDAQHGIDVVTMQSNLRTITDKAASLHVKTVVIGGISADGDVNFARSQQLGFSSDSATFVDATSLLMNPATRTSPIELNDAGAAQLATMIAHALSLP